MSWPTVEKLRDTRRMVVRMPPDELTLLMLLQHRKLLVDALWIWECQLEESMSTMFEEKAEAVASTPVPDTARIVVRSAFALALPAALFSIVAGASAALCVATFRFVLNLFS